MQNHHQPKVAAIILNYNSGDDTKKCISYLKRQDYENLDMIVVDNNSTELEQKKAVMSVCSGSGITFLESDKNGGYSYGNNIGIQYAEKQGAEWILIINPDVELRDAGYVRRVILEQDKWPNVGVIGTRSILPDGFNQNPVRELRAWEEIFFPLTYLLEKKKGRDYYKTKEQTGFCEKVVGCCIFLKMEFLRRNHYLDDHVFLYCEEPILAKSAERQGYHILYIDELEANHQHVEKFKQGSSKKRVLLAIESRKYYIDRYSGYTLLTRKLALLSKNIQKVIWKTFVKE